MRSPKLHVVGWPMVGGIVPDGETKERKLAGACSVLLEIVIKVLRLSIFVALFLARLFVHEHNPDDHRPPSGYMHGIAPNRY